MQTLLYLCGADYGIEQPLDHASIVTLIQRQCVLGQQTLTRNEAHILLAVFAHHPAITPDQALVAALHTSHLHAYYEMLSARDKLPLVPGAVSSDQRWTIERGVTRLRKKLRGTLKVDLARISSAAGYLLVPYPLPEHAPDACGDGGRAASAVPHR
jgi:hypothetical protein